MPFSVGLPESLLTCILLLQSTAGYRLKEMTNLSYTIYEQKPIMGGTWRLFTYPGIRCDSDMYTLGESRLFLGTSIYKC